MKEAAAQGRALMQRTVQRALLDMPRLAAQASDVIDRNLLAEAAKVLAKHEAVLIESYPQVLLSEFAHAIAGDARKAAAVSFDALELMGEEQVQESVEVLRAQQAVLASVEAELGELNALICAVQDLKAVQPDRNPLRPEGYVRALRNVVQQSPVSASVQRRWLIHLGAAMGPELARAYRELSTLLRSHGVSAAGFNVVQQAESAARATDAATAAARQQKSLLNVRELRRLLAGEFDPAAPESSAAVLGPDFSMTVPAAFETLEEMRQVDKMMQRLRERQAAMAAGGDNTTALRAVFSKEARSTAQALGLEVVSLMVDNIAGDARLLPPVQQAIRDLEPALMRLALTDPRFFSDKKHPARQLLEEMTQRSLAWTSADAPGFAAFIDPLRQAVDALLETRVPGAEPFDFALRTLQETWGDAQQRDRRYREKAVRALLQAEQRNLLAEKIAGELRARPDMAGAPREIAHFVIGPWAQVMAQARLADGSTPDPQDYGAMVGELVWSAQPALAVSNLARLARLVPQLVEQLRRGLASIDYPQAPTQRFLEHLAALHAQALKPLRPTPLSTTLTREELEAQFGDEAEAGSWLAPLEAQQSGFMQTHQSVSPRPLFQPTEPKFSDTQPLQDPALTPALRELGLKPGAWVEMFDGQWGRWQLTWASPHGTLFMFAHASGKTQSMTRRLLERLLAAGTLRMVSSQAVVDGALDAVAQAALRNSV
jgi:hypothetical protein